jgi:hypothetical protein
MAETGLIARVVNILTSPNTEWRVIAAEPVHASDIFYNYVLIMAAIPPVAALLGFSFFGYASVGVALVAAMLRYLFALGGLFFVVVVAQYLSPKFDGRDHFVQATKLVVYAHTASWVGGIFLLFPFLWLLHLAFALYGLYLLYAGCSAVMAVPREHAAGYTIAVIATVLVTDGALSIILGLVLDMGMMGVVT